MASSARFAKKSDPLNKKIPENPKYKHIEATIDTGASLSKYLKHLEEVRKNYRYRKDEIFKRLKNTTFVQLAIQVAIAESQEGEENYTRQSLGVTPPLPESPPESTLSSIAHGIGELDLRGGSSSPSAYSPVPPPPISPYLLLDIRDKDEYDLCHIITAKSYPAAMLSRSCNYFTQDILNYVNKPGKIIILYDNDERIASQATTVFVQRGVDNVFLLSGGLKVTAQTFPHGIISGSLPASCLPPPPPSSRRKQRAPPPHLPTPPTSVPPPSHPQHLSDDDIAVLQERLDDVLLAGVPSSRASNRSASSGRASSIPSTTCPGTAQSSFRAPSSTYTPWK